ncbi:unnamed protein product [Oppiella nova]|uniref:Lipase n=1 Tax=Oppiella nova TaxID=334625 RepID=A0A7R9QLN1_9ACAR|nr:unnamed protein product [Oppiella nova]CAG2167778.1 unnamed protein product [Oppiella nova]
MGKDQKDLKRTTPQLIESRNFETQTHYITTSDGYILTVYRIINPYLRHKSSHLKPILLQHGFTANSDVFLVSRIGSIDANGKYSEDNRVTDCNRLKRVGKTLGFVLSACGYDVWLSNIRGNKYSTNHTTLDPKEDHHFWRFTIDELSQIDLPVIIDYIRKQTDKPKIGYVGYSMGTTLMFALLSSQPEYSGVIDPFIALAPVVYLSRLPKYLKRFTILEPFLRAFPMPLIRFGYLRKFTTEILSGQELTDHMAYMNAMAAHLIDESSTLVLSHYLQMISNDNFGRYDYGLSQNLYLYGSPKSPDYPLANITSHRIAFIESPENDIFSGHEDLQRLKSELKVDLLMDYRIPDNKWTHVDYLFHNRADKYVTKFC